VNGSGQGTVRNEALLQCGFRVRNTHTCLLPAH
jgi:hypothetical protein